jgi:GNAT superfamily N-acetyltransferase
VTIEITLAPGDFSDWKQLLALLHRAYAYMEDRIDPPSSVHRLTEETIAEKSKNEILVLATEAGELVGCAFAKPDGASLYVGKLGVDPSRQGRGIGRQLMEFAETLARERGLSMMELETRIELLENHRAFAAMGYSKTTEKAHEGYDRPTYIVMRKQLSSPS